MRFHSSPRSVIKMSFQISRSAFEGWHRSEENTFFYALGVRQFIWPSVGFKGNLIQPCKERWLVLTQGHAVWIQKRLKIRSSFGLPTNNEALPSGTPGGDKWMPSVHMSSPPILHIVSLSLSFSLYLPLFISPPLSLAHSLSSVFCCLLRHYHKNTPAHTLREKKGGGGEWNAWVKF